MKLDATTICVMCVIAIAVLLSLDAFLTKKKNSERIKTVKSWLLFCVIKMEKVYGSGTGQLKLRAAWDLALQRFPFLAIIVTFDEFKTWVDEALDEMKKMLSDENVAKFIRKE